MNTPIRKGGVGQDWTKDGKSELSKRPLPQPWTNGSTYSNTSERGVDEYFDRHHRRGSLRDEHRNILTSNICKPCRNRTEDNDSTFNTFKTSKKSYCEI